AIVKGKMKRDKLMTEENLFSRIADACNDMLISNLYGFCSHSKRQIIKCFIKTPFWTLSVSFGVNLFEYFISYVTVFSDFWVVNIFIIIFQQLRQRIFFFFFLLLLTPYEMRLGR
ncbi:hypothetical protein BD560DRAFT_329508, partial [Blakeslea trispora]